MRIISKAIIWFASLIIFVHIQSCGIFNRCKLENYERLTITNENNSPGENGMPTHYLIPCKGIEIDFRNYSFDRPGDIEMLSLSINADTYYSFNMLSNDSIIIIDKDHLEAYPGSKNFECFLKDSFVSIGLLTEITEKDETKTGSSTIPYGMIIEIKVKDETKTRSFALIEAIIIKIID